MIMHLAQTIADECYNPNVLFFNSGNMFVHNHPKEFHVLTDIFTLPNIPIYNTTCSNPFTRINKHWYKNERYTTSLRLIYENIQLSPRLESFVHQYRTVVHIRAEKDWVHVARMCSRKHHCYTIDDIYTKVKDPTAAVAICTKNSKTNTIAEIHRHFKTILPTIDQLSYTENSAVQMLTAVHSNHFWGNWFSTFSKGVAHMRLARGLNTYFYNCIHTTKPYERFKFACDTVT